MEEARFIKNEDHIYHDIPKIDIILDQAGYTQKTWKIIILTGFYIFCEGSQLTLISTLFTPLKEYYELTDNNLSFTSSLMYIGVALGSILSNFFSSHFSRPTNLKSNIIILTLSNTVIAIIPNFTLFTILRFIIGFNIGVMLPMIFGILTEYLPLKRRGFCLMSIWLFFGLGGLYMNCSMLIFMPNLEEERLNLIILLLSIPYSIFTIIYCLKLEESPRKLILINNYDEGFRILEEIKQSRISNEDRKQIISEIQNGINKELTHDLKSVFHSKFFRTSCIQSFIWVSFSYIFYGGMFSIGLLIQDLDKSHLVLKTIIIYSFSMPGNIIGGILSEVKTLGRLKTCSIGNASLCLFLVLLGIFPERFEIILGFLGLSLNICFNVISTYCSEIYPTQIRDTALGYFYFLTRISAFLSQSISLFLIQIDYRLQYLVIILMSVSCFILIFFLPVEPIDMPLDHNPENFKSSKLQEI